MQLRKFIEPTFKDFKVEKIGTIVTKIGSMELKNIYINQNRKLLRNDHHLITMLFVYSNETDHIVTFNTLLDICKDGNENFNIFDFINDRKLALTYLQKYNNIISFVLEATNIGLNIKQIKKDFHCFIHNRQYESLYVRNNYFLYYPITDEEFEKYLRKDIT